MHMPTENAGVRRRCKPLVVDVIRGASPARRDLLVLGSIKRPGTAEREAVFGKLWGSGERGIEAPLVVERIAETRGEAGLALKKPTATESLPGRVSYCSPAEARAGAVPARQRPPAVHPGRAAVDAGADGRESLYPH